MQNAPAMLAQKMMSRQATYSPVGMVSQNMSGNKKGVAAGGGGGLLGLNFNAANITTGLVLSNNNTTVTNSTASTYTSAVGNSATNIGDTSVYWEFIWGNGNDQWCGFAISTFNANHANVVGSTVGQAANTCAIRNTSAQWAAAGASISSGTTFLAGDVLGLHLKMTASTINVDYYKNGALVTTRNFSTYLTLGNTVSYVPAWSSWSTGAASSISNYVYTAPIGATVLTSPNTSALIAVSASVPAVADGAYDVYTFNASGTFTTTSTGAVRALVIAGGGGGQNSGGAGAGGYQEKGVVATPQTYTITVGAGASGTGPGSNSSFATNVVSTGGGSGGGSLRNGGSGSGALDDGTTVRSAGTGITGQGFAGGSATYLGLGFAGGGGGGAGGVGGSGTDAVGGNGGAGVTSSITGTAVARGGGGAGHSFSGTDNVGTASAGGGGGSGGAGAANTGGGGSGWNGGSGGSGVVIIRVRARA